MLEFENLNGLCIQKKVQFEEIKYVTNFKIEMAIIFLDEPCIIGDYPLICIGL